jgi:hypothetical protein
VRRLELAAIAAAIGVIAVLVAPSCRGPSVTMAASALVVDRHGDVALSAVVKGSIGRIAVELDGASARTPPTFEPPLPADCGDGCTITVHWDGDEAGAGAHDLAVIAYDDAGHHGAAHVALDVRDRVTAAIARPVSLDLRGRAAATIVVHARYRGAVRGALTVDGGAAIAARADDCRDGCDLSFPIELAALRGGPHALAWTVTDGGGAIARGADTLVAGDMPWVSAIRVTGETDGPGTRLEVEVHLEDADSGADLGCSGQDQGMGPVDYDDTDYAVRAWFVKPDGAPLGLDDLAGRRVRVHVIEDDSQPCPGPITRDDDDMGRSAPVAPGALPSVRGGFGEVVAITLAIGRPR